MRVGVHTVWPALSRRTSAWCAQSTSPSSPIQARAHTTHHPSGKFVLTKKKFSELPSSHSLPDGTTATPLAPWTGGILASPQGLDESSSSSGAKNTTMPGNNWCHARPCYPTAGCGSGPREELETLPPMGSQMNPSAEPLAGDQGYNSHLTTKKVVTTRGGHNECRFDEVTSPGKHAMKTYQPVAPKTRTRRKTKTQENPNADELLPSTRSPRNQLAVEILQNLKSFPHCILLTRVGQFYESYFEQAADVAKLLNIKLTTRTWDKQQVLMCGFPLMHFDRHLKTLVQQHKRSVALCEEFPRYEDSVKRSFNRRVVRVLTPGTLIDEPFLNPYENNYVLAVTQEPTSPMAMVGLAWMDVSTGEFFSKAVSLTELYDEIVRISPREVVLDEALQLKDDHPIQRLLLENVVHVSYGALGAAAGRASVADVLGVSVEGGHRQVSDELTFPIEALKDPNLVFTDEEKASIELLLSFLRANLMEYMPDGATPYPEKNTSRMQIDAHTIRALEIREGMREGGGGGSVFSVLKKTVTTGGTRLLSRWLCSPSASLVEINARQNLVAFFQNRTHLQYDIIRYLREADDAVRVVQRFLLGRGDVDNLWTIANTVTLWSRARERIQLERVSEQHERWELQAEEWSSMDVLLAKFSELGQLSSKILGSLAPAGWDEAPILDTTAEPEVAVDNEEPGSTILQASEHVGNLRWTIKPDFSPQLADLHSTIRRLGGERDKLEHRFRIENDAPSLTLKLSSSHSFHVHIGKNKRDLRKINQSSAFVTISESNSTKTFFNKEWFQLGCQMVDTNLKIQAAQKEALETLRRQVNLHALALRQNARVMDELDVAISFAALATERNFVRPILKDDTEYRVIDGRHPTVEFGLTTSGRVFAPNSVDLSFPTFVHLITGPNMGGKSTLLRQTALISVLAQVGSFVPASYAELGIVDRVFSRIGAGDDLFRDRSTFMVEMLETADILNRATSRSLVIMDEVGRGTTVRDGLAIAYAALHHLCTVNRCKTLFATHFHDLAGLMGYRSEQGRGRGVFENVAFFCTHVDEIGDGHFAYRHRLQPGVNRDSHGLKVAQLAGMPPTALNVASDMLTTLRKNSDTLSGLSSRVQ